MHQDVLGGRVNWRMEFEGTGGDGRLWHLTGGGEDLIEKVTFGQGFEGGW